MFSFSGSKTIYLDLSAAFGSDIEVADCDLLDWEHLAPVAAMSVIVAEGNALTCSTAGCLLSFVGAKGNDQHILVSVPMGDGLTNIEVVVDKSTREAVDRLMAGFEVAAQAVLCNTISQEGDSVGVNAWGQKGPGTADLILVDDHGRTVFEASCRRDIDGVYEAIAAGRRNQFAS